MLEYSPTPLFSRQSCNPSGFGFAQLLNKVHANGGGLAGSKFNHVTLQNAQNKFTNSARNICGRMFKGYESNLAFAAFIKLLMVTCDSW